MAAIGVHGNWTCPLSYVLDIRRSKHPGDYATKSESSATNAMIRQRRTCEVPSAPANMRSTYRTYKIRGEALDDLALLPP